MSLVKSLCVAALLFGAIATVALAATISSSSPTIIGTPGNDTITALGSSPHTILGLAGSDLIYGGPGDNKIYGDGSCPPGVTDINYCSTAETPNDGNDNITGGGGSNTIYGMGGNDNITGGPNDNYIDGGSGNDIITGGGGNNILIGGPGADTIKGGNGISVIYAVDGEKDKISCGKKGQDIVYADKIDDVSGPCMKIYRYNRS